MNLEKWYFTGNPCKHGHVDYRLKSTRACRECLRLVNIKWREDNPSKLYCAVKRWRSENKEKTNAWFRAKSKDPVYSSSKRISRAIAHSLNGAKSGRGWESIVGYCKQELMTHLERQFVDGMGWQNMGEWHIDHITPKSAFNLTNDDEVRACWALPNLRPIWATENCKKRHKITHLI